MTHRSIPGILLVTACLAGCSQVVVPEKLADNLRSLQSDLATGRNEVVKTTASLRNLRDNKGADVKPQFATFNAQLSDLDRTVGGIKAAGSISRDQANAFFKEWETKISQIQDENVAKSSQERRQQTIEAYDKLKAKIQALREAYTPYYSGMNDVRTAMTVDTTQQGASAARPAMNKAIDGEKDVLNRLDDVNKAISHMLGS